MTEPEDLMARLRESIDQHKRPVTSSAQTPEPTDEQRAVAMAAVWPEANPLMWKFATADDRATRDRVARALAAAVTAEREKVVAAVNNVHPEVVYQGQRWCGSCADPGYGGVLYPCPTIEAIREVSS